jgi:hypothetical protein
MTDANNDYFEKLHEMVEADIAGIDKFLAEVAAKQSAKFLATNRLRQGHMLALEAHVELLAEGMGNKWMADYLRELARDLESDDQALEDEERQAADESEWESIWNRNQQKLHANLQSGNVVPFRRGIEE